MYWKVAIKERWK